MHSTAEIMQQLRAAIALLESVDRSWAAALRAEHPDSSTPEITHLEELLHSASHETASSLACYVQEIERLLMRVKLRELFPMFTPSQFDRIVNQGWSTSLAYELKPEHASMALPDLSALIKELCQAWERLPGGPNRQP